MSNPSSPESLAALSVEEKEELLRSMKKVKANSSEFPSAPHKVITYKDTLVGSKFKNCESFFLDKNDTIKEEDMVDHPPNPDLILDVYGNIFVWFSKEEKTCICRKWEKTLIIKVFGKTFGYQYLLLKINQIWKPSNALQLIELGFSFFGVKFMYVDDFDVIAKGGPWFINGCFLTMRRWHPNFSASEATLHSVVVWVHIIKLPLEYYDSEVLVKIDHSIGTLLRANNALSSKMRGKYDRFLIQVNIVDPLKKWLKVDGSM
ncbi:hypothetical protein PVK06_009241 [Gossypium arboreum]|uniref:DUF4283 domain-containing protein n=1 Tax=Gossypium arboreum TaxID=29729 RepID=A0ABR0QN46_GOSAR|nr:hypothetical protein PVK06_009241 [Gossypium arboreum]